MNKNKLMKNFGEMLHVRQNGNKNSKCFTIRISCFKYTCRNQTCKFLKYRTSCFQRRIYRHQSSKWSESRHPQLLPKKNLLKPSKSALYKTPYHYFQLIKHLHIKQIDVYKLYLICQKLRKMKHLQLPERRAFWRSIRASLGKISPQV